MRPRAALPALLAFSLLASPALAYKYKDLYAGRSPQAGEVLKNLSLDRELEDRILSLDPGNISQKEVDETLSKAPAPQMLGIHGGIYPVYLCMISFGEFLIRMGYPERSVLQPGNGAFSYSCYFDAKNIAGAVAWHYERDGMRPMLVGHSQGGIQVMKVLHELAGHFSKKAPVWNPLTGKSEKRETITDPFTGGQRPVIGVGVSYASAVGAGGLTRLLPNQWIMNAGLRSVPDTVSEFTGFSVEGDILGGDMLGIGGSNAYRPNGHAAVRNVPLSLGHDHVTIPNTKHLALNPSTKRWINEFHPVRNPKPDVKLEGNATNLGWAAEVWYSIKKSWCLELQNLIKEKRKADGETVASAPQRRRVLVRRGAARSAF